MYNGNESFFIHNTHASTRKKCEGNRIFIREIRTLFAQKYIAMARFLSECEKLFQFNFIITGVCHQLHKF